MFKKGDKIIVIDIEGLNAQGGWSVDLYGEYEIEEHTSYVDHNDGETKSVTFLKNINGAFHSSRFITLAQFRKQKIKKLLYNYGQK